MCRSRVRRPLVFFWLNGWGRQVHGWGMQVRHSKVYSRRAGASLPSRSNRPMFL